MTDSRIVLKSSAVRCEPNWIIGEPRPLRAKGNSTENRIRFIWHEELIVQAGGILECHGSDRNVSIVPIKAAEVIWRVQMSRDASGSQV